MHNPDYKPNSTFKLGENNVASVQLQFLFPSSQEILTNSLTKTDKKLGDLIANKIQRKEFFYGIEISAHSFWSKTTVLDYSIFGSVMPLFTSLIWFSADYAQIENIKDIESVRSARILESHTNILPHFTAYKVNKNRLTDFLDLSFSNVLILRGDQFDPSQEFKYAADMVAQIRKIRGGSISIGVGGYPEGHIDSKNLDDDLEFLLQKVKAGADFIITQVCFSSQALLTFVRKCREKGITVPIIIGVFIPHSEGNLKRIMEITGATLPKNATDSYELLKNNPKNFRDFAINSTANMISEVLTSDLGIYGIHFFTLNRFKSVQSVLQKLAEVHFQSLDPNGFFRGGPQLVITLFLKMLQKFFLYANCFNLPLVIKSPEHFYLEENGWKKMKPITFPYCTKFIVS